MSVLPYVVEVHPALIGRVQAFDLDRLSLLERLDRSVIRDRLFSASIDVAELRYWFENAKIEVAPTKNIRRRDLNTELFPRDEYYLNR